MSEFIILYSGHLAAILLLLCILHAYECRKRPKYRCFLGIHGDIYFKLSSNGKTYRCAVCGDCHKELRPY